MAQTENGTVRGSILAAASSVFAASGYESGSLTEVANVAGVSRQNLLYYFPSKKNLLTAVLEARDDEFDARLRWMDDAAIGGVDDFAARLKEVLSDIFRDRELMALYHRLTSEAADPDHPAHEWVARRYARVREAATRVLEDAQRRGELRVDVDPRGFAIAFLGAVEGIEAQWLVDEEVDWSAAVFALHTLILGLRA